MKKALRILLVEDSDDDTLLLLRELRKNGCDPVHERVDTPEAMKVALDTKEWDIIVADFAMPSFSGLDALRMVKERELDVPFIVVSGKIGEETATELMKAGAHDYILKGNMARLAPAIEREMLEAEVRRERKKAEEALRTTTEELADLYNNAPCGYHSLDKDGVFTRINDTELRWLGYSREEVIGKMKFHDLITGRGLKTFQDNFPQFKVRGWVHDLEFEMVRKDGSILPVLLSASAVTDPAGNYVMSRSTVYDITERKQAEREIVQLAAIVEFSDDAIIGKTLDGIVTSWNKGAERIYGYTAEEIVGKPISTLIPPDHADEVSQILDKIRLGEHIEHYETVRRRKDGQLIEMSLAISPIRDTESKITGASTIARDITELKNVEIEFRKLNEELEQRVNERTADLNRRSTEVSESQQALMNIVEDLNEKTEELEMANAKLKEFDRLKSMFIASMSHELRTPLNSIIGFSSVILNEWIGPVNAEQKENLAIILRCGKHLLNLINDVIDVSKIEAGKIEAVAEEFDLSDLISEAVSLIKKDMDEKGLNLQVATTHQQMHMDRRRLLQCVLNLLSNAMKFTEQGGVTVEGRIVQSPGEAPEGGVAEISVTDTGIGIREEDLPKMCQPFVRLASPLQATVPGTGLGLYLTRKLAAEVLKGDILVTSEYGKGSRFTIRIPVRIP